MSKRFAAVLALTLSCANTFAGAHASARLSDLRIELHAFGAAAPSVTFTSHDGSLVRATTYSTASGVSSEVALSGGIAFGPALCASPGSSAVGSFAQILGDPFGDGASVFASAFAHAGATQAEGAASLGDGNNYATFTLSPDTLMVITGMVDLDVAAGTGSPDDYAIGSVDLELSGSHGDSAQASAAHSVALAGGLAGASDSRHMLLSIAFTNAFDVAIDGTFFGGVDATAVSGVPEPAPGGLATAGLALVAIALRGARRRAPPALSKFASRDASGRVDGAPIGQDGAVDG